MKVRGWIPYEGKFVIADNIPTGRPILYSAEEWAARTRVNSRWVLKVFGILLVVLVIPMWVVFALLLNPGVELELMLIVILASTAPPSSTIIFDLYYGRKAYRMGIHSGLYQNGVLLRVRGRGLPSFVPYDQILDFSVKRVNLSHEWLMLVLRDFKRPVRVDLAQLLGVEGQAVLRTMITSPSEELEAPELHVYGGRGSRVRSIPRGMDQKGSED